VTKATRRARYTREFKQEAVRLVEGGQSIAAAARTLGVVDQTLFNSFHYTQVGVPSWLRQWTRAKCLIHKECSWCWCSGQRVRGHS
jgi:transposase-like protein